jgi:hypothetical protein
MPLVYGIILEIKNLFKSRRYNSFMFNWKLIVTVIILLGIIAFFIYTQAPVQDFFKSVSEQLFSFLGHRVVVERNISFSIVTDYESISFKDAVNITMQPVTFSANINNMKIDSRDAVNIDFSGSGKISGRILSLDGTTDRIEVANSSMAFESASLKSEATFNELTIDNMELNELRITSGSLFVKGTEIKFTGPVVIYNPEGRFEFYVNNSMLKAEGLANRISIPKSGIVID